MAWDSTKSTAADPDNPTAAEQNPASEWNEMITYLKARVGNSLFNAYSILYADVDDTPAALAVAASRIIGRKATGGIAAMTAAELKTLVGQWNDTDTVDSCHAGNTIDHVYKITNVTQGEILYTSGTAILKLAVGTAGKVLTTHGAAANPTWETVISLLTCTLVELNAAVTDATLIDTGDGRLSDARTPTAHNQSATTITSGTLPVARGGTGVTGDTYDADKVDGCHAGTGAGEVYKIGAAGKGSMIQYSDAVTYDMAPGTAGYQLTSQGVGTLLNWSTAADLIFSDTHCPKCGLEFQEGDVLVLYLIGKNEVGDILTIPMHKECAESPKKTVAIKRKVMEEQYILDELTGETKVQRIQKMQEKTVTKHKMKEGYVLDNKSGKAFKIGKDGKQGKTKYNLSAALETVEETVSEVVYEDVEFTL